MGNTRVRRRAVPSPVDRKTARVAEENFFERLSANINGALGVYNPLDNRTYDASPRNRVMKALDDRSTEVKGLIKRLAERDLMKTYDEMPKNGILLHEISHKELLSNRGVRVVVAGATFSPVEEFITLGASRRRAVAAELARVKDMIVQNEQVFYYVGAFSTTGWEEDVRRVLSGSNYLIALSDIHEDAWRTHYAPDPRWRAAARLFDMTSEEEKIEAIRRWIRKRTFELLMDELTEDLAFEELGYAIPIIREAFEAIAAEDNYVRFDTATRPYRLVRIYG